MVENYKLFSQEWCDAAKDAVNSNSDVLNGFKDANSFTNRMEFGTIGRDDLASHIEWDSGRIVSWTPRKFEHEDLWLIINGSLATWQRAAAGEQPAGKLLLAGQIKFAKGPMTAAIENAPALNAFLLSWGQVPTEWDL